MATLTVHTREKTLVRMDISPAVSILNTLLRNDVAIDHKCGGRAMCGTCRVQIVQGGQRLSPIKENERVRLKSIGAPDDYRLACQTFAFGDITIQVPAPLEQS